jgi:anti-anti-sigma factor
MPQPPRPPLDAGRPGRVDVLDAVERLARAATREFDVDDLLRELCASVENLVELSGSGVMRVRDGRSRYVHATEGRSRRLERLQDVLQQGPCAQAVTTGQPVVVEDLTATTRWPELGEAAGEVGLRAALSLPLTRDEQVWAVLDLYRAEPGRLDAEELRVARALTDLAAGYIALASERDAGRRAQTELAHRALHDPLTGVANRALLADRLQHALWAARRNGRRVGVLFVDLDDFKQVNDRLGHRVGDQLLVEAARRLADCLRAGDTLARTGGDEFVILCEDLPAEGAQRLLEHVAGRVREVLARSSRVGPVDLAVPASVGAALADPGENDPDALIAAADEAMYRAKREVRSSRTVDWLVIERSRRPSGSSLWILRGERDGGALLRLRGELDVASANALRKALDEEAEAGHSTVVDVSGLGFADSTGLSVLGTARTTRTGQPHPVRVIGASPLVARVLALGGLDHLLDQVDAEPTP